MTCPGCSAPMEALTLDGHSGRPLEIDLCAGCQAFWFDGLESVRLSPAGTLELFTLIGERSRARRGRLAGVPTCPRCSRHLRMTHDRQRNTAFRYWRCPARHGRLITFFEFLREKDFIRPLTARQIAELRRHVRAVNCSNCGAPIDLALDAACGHCGSPLSMLDLEHTEETVIRLRAASAPRAVNPALPIELARARREVELAFGSDDPGWWQRTASSGLVEAGLGLLVRWLGTR